jgi:VIT1/CCC1 family predicted Fe2+/Mn2+ transporter
LRFAYRFWLRPEHHLEVQHMHISSSRTRQHVERHFTGSRMVHDIVIGMSDGLTVPFALAAGLSGAVGSSFVVVVAGLAEMAAGGISMGLGGYLAGRSELDTYRSELERERAEVRELPDAESDEVRQIFTTYGLTGQNLEAVVHAVTSNPKTWVAFMMREELGLENPDPAQALRSALTIGLSYVIGGLVPLAPYVLGLPIGQALLASVAVTLLALVIFGAFRAHFTGVPIVRGAVQTILVGGIAAAAAYGLARLVGSLGAGTVP